MLARPQTRSAAVVIAALAGAVILAGPAIAAAATVTYAPAAAARRAIPPAALRPVRYAGYTFLVPRAWPVISLAARPRTCVRFDHSAVYLGTPGPAESCPATLVGTSQAMLIEPAGAQGARSVVENPVARQITVRAPGISILARYSTSPALISQIVRSAGLPGPVMRMPSPVPQPAGTAGRLQRRAAGGSPASRHTIPLLPAGVTNYHGLGFDACALPSGAYMAAWRRHSPYRAVGVYIGGSELSCAQLNLSRRWLRSQAAAGWHFIPLYVGPQAEFGQLNKPARQGTAAADDAVYQAQQLGFRPYAPLYYDMEGFPPHQETAALRFLSAWTVQVHKLGYASGVYSSALSGIVDLARYYSCRTYAMPDAVYVGRWDGDPTTTDPVLRPSQWAHHQRLHQYVGNVVQTFSGDTLEVDLDSLDVNLHAPQPSGYAPPGAQPASTAPRHSSCPKLAP